MYLLLPTAVEEADFKYGIPLMLPELCALMLSCFGRYLLFATPGIIACQALLSMGFPSQENCSGLPRPPPGDLPNPGSNPGLLNSG